MPEQYKSGRSRWCRRSVVLSTLQSAVQHSGCSSSANFPLIILRAQSMALTRCLPILLLVAMTATAGASADRANSYLAKCYPPPTPTADGGSAFRGNLLNLLEALPSAAEPTGFAFLRTGCRDGANGALVLGLCSRDSAPKPCRRCLSNAGKKITEQCGDASRRAIFSDGRCSLSYADGANCSFVGWDEHFCPVVFSGDTVPSLDIVSVQRVVALAQSLAPLAAKVSVATADTTIPASKGDATAGNRTVRVAALCATDHAAADCGSCLRDASLSMAESWGSSAVVGRVAWVLGSNCSLRFEITPPLPLGEKIRRMMKDNILIALVDVFLIVVVIVDVCARRAKARNAVVAAPPPPAAAAAAALGDMSGIRTTK